MTMVSLGWLHVRVSPLFSAANIYGSSQLGWLETHENDNCQCNLYAIYTRKNQNSINNIA